jgi:DNA repair exonuclease SbcCD ATPase subunit
MRLISIRLLNFKGIPDFTFTPDGQNADIYGDNGTGKTTLKDAYLWLITGKDSENKADFAIKTLDKNNVPLPGLNHEVEGVFDIGRKATLKKVYAEKWTKKRGSVKTELTGHTTDHFIDGVPKSEKEYLALIAQIAPEETLKILTNPSYFSKMPDSPKLPGWKKRRNILLEVCGDLTDSDVIASDKRLAKIPDILPEGRTLEEHKKVIDSRRSHINDELKKIPIRIDEANRAMPTLPTRDTEELNLLVASYKARKEEKQQGQARIISGGEVAEKKRQLAEVQGEIITLRNEGRTDVDKKIDAKMTALRNIKGTTLDLQQEIDSYKRSIEGNNKAIDTKESMMATLREDWRTADAVKFEYSPDTVCPTCGQNLPEEQLTAARDMAQAEFNCKKAEKLESINKEGVSLAGSVKELKERNLSLVAQIATAESTLNQAQFEYTQLSGELLTLQNQPIQENPALKQKIKEREQIETAIQQLNTGNEAALEQVRNQITDLDIVIRELNDDLDKIRRRKDGQKRIAELGAEEKTLAAEFEKLEGELFLCDQFIKTKVALMDEKINSKFKLARFKMFKENINGGLEDCCEVLYGGVPYGSGLNAGHRSIVGMDIIRTLSEYYNFEAPIFVDNAESVTTLPEMNAQVIRLIKPEITDENRQKYSKLVIETESKKEYREAI